MFQAFSLPKLLFHAAYDICSKDKASITLIMKYVYKNHMLMITLKYRKYDA